MNIHEKYIYRCIQLAQNALGNTYPNPVVGSVVVYKNQIIGEGWHQKAGTPHAEVNAIRSVKDQSLLQKSTIYVSLEPCSHYGKTPPCSDLIISRGIKKVVIACVDPFSEVAGRGIKKLMDSGCKVTVGILEKQSEHLNRRFFTFHKKNRPYIILKWAQSLDGFIAPVTKKNQDKRAPVWISNKYSRQLVHKWRSQEQAILVGTNTAVADNPRLDTRHWAGSHPVRVLLDQHLRVPKNSFLLDGSVKTIIICSSLPPQKRNNVIYETANFEEELASQICEILFRHGLQSVIIEGGSRSLQTFVDSGLWDEARVFTGAVNLKAGLAAPQLSGNLKYRQQIAGDQLKVYTND